jgi:hypothetical protein
VPAAAVVVVVSDCQGLGEFKGPAVTWAFVVERVRGIEPPLSAWETYRAHALLRRGGAAALWRRLTTCLPAMRTPSMTC